METSALVRAVTRFVVLALLLLAMLSVVVVVIVAVALSVVPDAVVVLTPMTGENVALPPEASEAMVHVMVPPLPIAGVVHDQPAGTASDRKFVPAGNGS